MDLSDLAPVLTAEGPFVTVHVGADSALELAADRYELAWKNATKELEAQGVPEPVRAAVSAARGDHADGPARLVVATVPDATVRLSEPVSSAPPADVVDVGPLPRLLPLVADRTTRVPHVVVHADRTGADVVAYYDTDKVANEVTVKGATLHLHKVPSGGWSQLRYQHRAENQWARNGEEIADTVRQLAEQVGAELVIGVGDQREVDLVKRALPAPWQERYVEIPGGRGPDGGEDLVEQRVRDAVALHAAAGILHLLEDFSQERGQAKRACDGVEDVVAALRRAHVETLLVTTSAYDAAGEAPTLWYGPDPAVLGTSRDEVAALGVDAPQEGPLVDVLLRAAVATGAGVQLVPHEPANAPRGGVGAVLRYADDDHPAARS